MVACCVVHHIVNPKATMLVKCAVLAVITIFSVGALGLQAEEADYMRDVSSHIARFAGPEGAPIRAKLEKIGGVSCSECQMIVGILIQLTNSTAGLNTTKTIVDDFCKAEYANDAAKRDECLVVGDLVVWALPKIFKALTLLAWDIPLNLCSILIKVCKQPCCTTPYTPEQMLLSFPNSTDFTSVMITWVTLEEAPNARVMYWAPGAPRRQAAAVFSTYTEGGWVGTINRAVMTGLPAGSPITYSVGSDASMSANITFNTLPSNIGTAARPLRIINVADMGWGSNSDYTIPRLIEHVENGDIDIMVHHGDIGYADGEMNHWDLFVRRIQPISSRIPYLTTPGNHEFWFNFSAYQHRLHASMPQEQDVLSGSMFYSVTIGPVQMLFLNTETWIDTAEISKEQVAWVSKQLASRTVPWSLVFHHRPLYCNRKDHGNCEIMASILQAEIEDVYIQNKVDMVVSGHEHYYLRSYPTAHWNATGTSYDSPSSPVYVLNGAAGNRESNPNPNPLELPFAVGTQDRGYGIISVWSDATANNNVMQYSFFTAENNALFDQINITKRV